MNDEMLVNDSVEIEAEVREDIPRPGKGLGRQLVSAERIDVNL